MPNLPISGLTASASNAAATDVLPVVQTTGTGPVKMTVQQMAGGLLGSTTLSGATITADAPVLNMSQTWNNGAVTFTGLKFNAATGSNTGSASGSLLMDLQLEGTSRFKVSKTGNITALGLFDRNNALNYTYFDTNILYFAISDVAVAAVSSGQFRIRSLDALGFSSGTTNLALDTILTRRAAANLRLGAADAAVPVAQTLSVQSGTAGASATTVSISGTALTIAGTVTGTIAIGHAVTGTGVSAGTLITAGSGTSWTVNNSQTVGPITAYFNSVGQNLTLTGSQGSGPSAGGSIIFQVAPAGSAATTAQNALATALTIDSTQTYSFGASGGTNTTLRFGGANYFVTAARGETSINFGVNGDDRVQIGTFPSIVMAGRGYYGWSNGSVTNTATTDLYLYRDDANKLALRNGNNGQTFRLYGRFTDITNDFERFFIEAPTTSGAAVLLGTQKGATTGAARALEFQTDGTTRLTIASSGGVTASSTLSALGSIQLLGTSEPNRRIVFNGVGFIKWPSDGVCLLQNDAGTDFGRLQFGGTDANFPALKRSSTTLIVRLANDTANAPLESASLKTDAPAGGTAATWKLGVRVAATTLLDTTQYIEVDVGGTLYKLAVVTT
jgi:hypothetical protein